MTSDVALASLFAFEGGGGDDALFCLGVNTRHPRSIAAGANEPSQCSSLESQQVSVADFVEAEESQQPCASSQHSPA